MDILLFFAFKTSKYFVYVITQSKIPCRQIVIHFKICISPFP